MPSYSTPQNLGPCPICGRDMIAGASVNRHHFIPKSRGGKAQEEVHVVCHRQLHALWTEKELEQEFSDPEIIKADPRMIKFIAWIQKKPNEFNMKIKSSNEKRVKKGTISAH